MELHEGGERPLRERLVAAREAERHRLLLDLIRTHTAAATDGKARTLDPGRAFGEQGVRGRSAARLRELLAEAAGLALPATVVFDYPTPRALAEHLTGLLLGADAAPGPAAGTGAAADEPIAIVGMGCRLPGGVNSPDDLWELVRSETDAISEFPTDRGWDVEFNPDPDHIGTTVTRHAGFLYDAPDFDADFFAISPGEAVTIDPQHRLLLETTWEAIEGARLDPTSLRGSSTGVFVGLMYSEYGARIRNVPPSAEGYRVVGSMPSVASGRLAYTFGFEGPAVTVDTACSSSLVAMHLAAESLRKGECSLAVAGGATVMSTPWGYIEFSRQRGLAPDGRARSFSADAAGSSWSEGVGVVVLERLSDARRNGHRVLAVLRGSAVNQDGASNGLTAPNGPAQQQVIRQALTHAGLSTADVDVVDAHGAGTRLGDPIEAQALLATYGQGRPAEQPLWLGSLKSNIGHTQAAAGVSGVIKMVMAIRNGVLPRSLHITEPTPVVDWASGAVELLTEARDWPETGRPRRAGVSSFGVGGTNAHVILEQPEPEPELTATGGDARPLPWPLSGRGAAGLRAQAGRIRDFLAAHPEVPDADVAYSLTATRAALPDRAVVVAADRTEAMARLAALADGGQPEGVALATAADRDRPVFVFPGQGSQWPGMAAELMSASPVFRESIEACEKSLAPYVDWSLTKVLRGKSGAPTLERVDVVQPALFAVMVSLAALWRSFGVEPAAVVGHSQGEIAAAHVAGALCLDDAARIVAVRSRALRVLSGRGGMVSVAAPVDRVRGALERWNGAVSVAAVNGPRSVVISGDPTALDEAVEAFTADGVRAKKIPVDYASHSAQVEEIRETLLETLAGIEPRSAGVPFYSTVTGEPIDTTALDTAYWVTNLRETVQFDRTVRRLIDDGHTGFAEMSPHPVLTVGVQETADDLAADAVTLDSLRRNEGGVARFLTAVGEAHAHGIAVDFSPAFGHAAPRPVDLPTYAFQRRRYWLEEAAAPEADLASAGLDGVDHPLLGATISLPDGGTLCTGTLSARSHPWLTDHGVADVLVVPGTALVEQALHAGARAGCEVLEELVLQAPLILPEQGTIRVQLAIGAPDESGRRGVTLHSRANDAPADEPWTRHAEGTLARAGDRFEDLPGTWPPAGAEEIELDDCYRTLAKTGLHYGAAFQGLRRGWRLDEDVYVEAELPESGGDAGRYGLHPALFDAALHIAAFVGLPGAAADEDVTRLPFSWNGVALHAAGAGRLRARIRFTGPDSLSLAATDPAGRPVVSVASLGMRPVTAEALHRAAASAGTALLRLEWQPLTRPETRDRNGRRAWIGDGDPGAEYERHDGLAGLRAGLDGGAPDVVVLAQPPADDDTDTITAAHRAVHRVLADVQDWLADDRLAGSRLVVLTRGAVGSSPDPALAAVWGLVRSAQSENPDRITLVDLDGRDASRTALPAALDSGEAQIAVRDGALLVPRLARVTAHGPTAGTAWRTDGTVLVTGGLGVLGRLMVRHLVTAHGIRHVVVVSRSGSTGDGVTEFAEELRAEGAELLVIAGDAADRAVLEGALASIPAERPLTAVVHMAGVLDDGVLTSLTPERADHVLRPKADAAWHLHELTAGTDVPLVVFSSLSSVLGPAGQGSYAAANAFVDALVERRRGAGAPGLALGWGLWAARSGLTGDLDEADIRRMARSGVQPLSSDQGLALFDLARAGDDPVVFPLHLDTAALGGGAPDDVPLPLRGLARTPARRATARTEDARPGGDSPADRLAGLSEAEQDAQLLTLVRTHVASVLGYDDPRTVGERRTFTDIGFDSLRALQLRNRLNGATGLRLPATLVFDHPTPAALGRYLRTRLVPDAPSAPAAEDPATPPPATPGEGDEAREQLRSAASLEEVFDLLDDQLGK
ncbi:type I polyketide synthase [Streptomyces sp. AV19]|uniref:type I polyketide synthase n=1 Tax=Streptomyces sp. AV19 TaxID=2793068 RepID=UPI002413895B|nr:type I polyketide synthase [Streptomyces sp. AV19]MDG4533493.1 type I polyketide synthase [Streptomyces sp. AV19]